VAAKLVARRALHTTPRFSPPHVLPNSKHQSQAPHLFLWKQEPRKPCLPFFLQKNAGPC